MLVEILEVLVKTNTNFNWPGGASKVLLDQAMKRMQRYGEHLERMISPEGRCPPVGRSLSHLCQPDEFYRRWLSHSWLRWAPTGNSFWAAPGEDWTAKRANSQQIREYYQLKLDAARQQTSLHTLTCHAGPSSCERVTESRPRA